MTSKEFREGYKVKSEELNKTENKSNVEEAFEKQVRLKNDKNYEDRFEKSFLQILNLFCDRYKTVGIDCPIARTKSDKSLKGKIEKLEIERLCTILEIDGLKSEQKEELYKLILTNGKVDKDVIQKKIKKAMFEKIDDLKLVESLMKEKDLNDNVKMAILRITRSRIEKEERDEVRKKQYVDNLEYNYGEIAAERTGKKANNLMHWENIQSVKIAKSRIYNGSERAEDRDILRKLYEPERYLKVKDLKGFRIVVSSVPDEIETDNEFLKGIIERRKRSPQSERIRYNDWCCIEVEKDFASFLENNPEVLEKMNLKLIARKEKSKQNGYLADHLKLCYIDKPEYSFEMQIRTLYRDDMARGNGPAGHTKRAGKKRELPNIKNKETFMKEFQYGTPTYTILQKDENGKYAIRKCNNRENFIAFYPEADLNSKEFKKMWEYLGEDSSNER